MLDCLRSSDQAIRGRYASRRVEWLSAASVHYCSLVALYVQTVSAIAVAMDERVGAASFESSEFQT